jgi:tetratricopeptide (TPR) repeat protein
LRDKQFNPALILADSLIAKSSGQNSLDAIRIAGSAATGMKKWTDASLYFKKLVAANQNDAMALYNLSVAAFNQGQAAEARNLYSRALVSNPALRDQAFEKCIALPEKQSGGTEKPDTLDEKYNAAVELQTSGDDSSAETSYMKIVEANSGYFRAWNNLGAIYSARGELEKAAECYEKAVEREHSFIEAYANLVAVYIGMEDFRRARKWLTKAEMHNPENELLAAVEKQLEQAMAGAGDK